MSLYLCRGHLSQAALKSVAALLCATSCAQRGEEGSSCAWELAHKASRPFHQPKHPNESRLTGPQLARGAGERTELAEGGEGRSED